MTQDPALIAKGLSAPMRAALDRYGQAYAWSDGRSTRALAARGLVRGVARDPEMFGDVVLHVVTPLGLAVRKHLEQQP